MTCINCLQGFYKSCLGGSCQGLNNTGSPPNGSEPKEIKKGGDSSEDSSTDREGETEEDTRPSARRGSRTAQGVQGSVPRRARSHKRDDALKDQQSTGRKRAAVKYPLDREAPCEWQGLKNCGGGINPINGCIDGKQQARHHGPDKSVVNNDEGNVHRICHRCHNRWHAANNKSYDWNSTTVHAHQPQEMSEVERWWVAAEDSGKEFKAIHD